MSDQKKKDQKKKKKKKKKNVFRVLPPLKKTVFCGGLKNKTKREERERRHKAFLREYNSCLFFYCEVFYFGGGNQGGVRPLVKK